METKTELKQIVNTFAMLPETQIQMNANAALCPLHVYEGNMWCYVMFSKEKEEKCSFKAMPYADRIFSFLTNHISNSLFIYHYLTLSYCLSVPDNTVPTSVVCEKSIDVLNYETIFT